MTIRAGVIGLGIGEQHAAFLDSAPGCALVAVCDRDEARLAATGARFPAAARYADARAMLDGAALDLVVVASYDADHAAQILDAIAWADEKGSKPKCIVSRTVKGKGVSFVEHPTKYHGAALTKDELAKALAELKEAK